MFESRKRWFDVVLIVLGFVLIVAVLDLAVLNGAHSRLVATSLVTWLMCSLPAAILVGHCALSEE